MELTFFPRKGVLLECVKGGRNGDGQHVRAGEQYAVERIFTADSDSEGYGSLKCNGESAEVTVTVRPTADQTGLPRDNYPFRWDLARFAPVRTVRGHDQRVTLCKSLEIHQIKPRSGFGLPVTLFQSDNKNLPYPTEGVIYAFEQGVDCYISQAVFHRAQPDGSLGAPVVVKNPQFCYQPR